MSLDGNTSSLARWYYRVELATKEIKEFETANTYEARVIACGESNNGYLRYCEECARRIGILW